MPLPTNTRKTAPGNHPGTAEARGPATAAAAGSLLLSTEAARTVRAAPPNSRRLAAATVHPNGSDPGPPSACLPAPNQATNVPRGALTDPAATTRRDRAATAPPLRATPGACATRTDGRTGAFTAESDELAPADPVVSANAIGTEAIAEPTPRATANAPTLPTYREYPGVTASADPRPNTMDRTRPREKR